MRTLLEIIVDEIESGLQFGLGDENTKFETDRAETNRSEISIHAQPYGSDDEYRIDVKKI